MAVAHYLEALDWQREFIKIHAVLGGKNPHLQSFLVGGMATPIDPDRQASLNAGSIAQMQELIKKGRDFVTRVYIPDLLAIASFYKEWAGYGAGVGNYLVYGEYPEEDGADARLFLPLRRHPQAGPLEDREVRSVENHRAGQALLVRLRRRATTRPSIPSRARRSRSTPGRSLPTSAWRPAGKYSWLKSPRYDGEPMEVGPLARMLVAYGSGQPRVKELVTLVLGKLGVGPEALFSTLGRVAARGIETQVLVEKMDDWLNGLAANMARRELRIADNSKWEPSTWPREASGVGFHEAPRGALGHWVHIRDGQIANYQCVVPSTWNAGPRDASGKRGPYEEALLGTPIARSHAATGDPADRALLRPLHRVRRPRRRRAEARARAREGPVSTARPLVDPSTIPPPADTDLVRVYVWQWPVRLAHWLIVISIFFLSWTGIYIGRPFLISAGEARNLFIMGTAKTIHFYSAIVFTMAVVVRIIWMFTGNRFSHWDKFIPVGKRRRSAFLPVLKYYLFGLRKPPGFVGHNPLAGLTYSLVFLLFLTMIGTGVALRTVSASYQSPLRIFSFLLPLYGGPQAARWIHHVGMWLIWGFAVHHVYSAILMSQVEGNGTIESIFSGYKFVHRDDVVYSGYRFLSRKDDHG